MSVRKLIATALALLVVLTGCSSTKKAPADPNAPLKVGASQVPHAEILKFVQDNLAEKNGFKLEIVVFNDYVQPNTALNDGSIDANYFQHQPYLDVQTQKAGYKLTAVTPVHLEPLALYSSKTKELSGIGDHAKIAIPNDPTNGARALKLLESKGLLKLKDTGKNPATKLDIKENPKNLEIVEIEAAQLPRSLADVDAAVINGNYAIPANLSPTKDALALESAQNNPYANILVTRTDNKDDTRVQKLAAALCSPETAKFIQEKYQGTVIPACPAK